jgi:hypothetical protein
MLWTESDASRHRRVLVAMNANSPCGKKAPGPEEGVGPTAHHTFASRFRHLARSGKAVGQFALAGMELHALCMSATMRTGLTRPPLLLMASTCFCILVPWDTSSRNSSPDDKYITPHSLTSRLLKNTPPYEPALDRPTRTTQRATRPGHNRLGATHLGRFHRSSRSCCPCPCVFINEWSDRSTGRSVLQPSSSSSASSSSIQLPFKPRRPGESGGGGGGDDEDFPTALCWSRINRPSRYCRCGDKRCQGWAWIQSDSYAVGPRPAPQM